jgi:hypothetical protein
MIFHVPTAILELGWRSFSAFLRSVSDLSVFVFGLASSYRSSFSPLFVLWWLSIIRVGLVLMLVLRLIVRRRLVVVLRSSVIGVVVVVVLVVMLVFVMFLLHIVHAKTNSDSYE